MNYITALATAAGALLIGGAIYNYHQHRKSNSDVRSTRTDEFSEFARATFAGGCFWCVESDMEKVEGVKEVVSGYAGGQVENPTYKQVSSGTTGHREAVQVFYDPTVVTYEQLLDVFWTHIDPTDGDGQFADRGVQYSPAIYYHNEAQRAAAERSKDDVAQLLDSPIAVDIVPYTNFYVAEDYHQDYYKKNPLPYRYYRRGSGRDDYIERVWGARATDARKKVCITATCAAVRPTMSSRVSQQSEERNYTRPDDATLKESLTSLQYDVTQKEKTEPAFRNKYWDNHREGIYVDVVSGEPLFSSTDKFDSGTGWPSFLKPIEPGHIVERDDYTLLYRRVELKSAGARSHLGHIIFDGPEDNDRVRYCINSAALRFIPKEELPGTPYERFLSLFEDHHSKKHSTEE